MNIKERYDWFVEKLKEERYEYLAIGLIISYLILGGLVAFIITTSHETLDLKIIGELLWFAGYIGFGVAYYLAYKTTRIILRFRIDLNLR